MLRRLGRGRGDGLISCESGVAAEVRLDAELVGGLRFVLDDLVGCVLAVLVCGVFLRRLGGLTPM